MHAWQTWKDRLARAAVHAERADLKDEFASARLQTRDDPNKLGRNIAEQLVCWPPDYEDAWREILAILEVQLTPAERARVMRKRNKAGRIATDIRVCAECGASMKGRRADAKVCSDVCRVRFHRAAR